MDTSANPLASAAARPRCADRRSGLPLLLRQVVLDLLNTSERRNLVALLTEKLARIAAVRSIRVNELSTALPSRSLQPVRARDYVAFAVPCGIPAAR